MINHVLLFYLYLTRLITTDYIGEIHIADTNFLQQARCLHLRQLDKNNHPIIDVSGSCTHWIDIDEVLPEFWVT